MKKINLVQGSPEWHEYRLKGIGASEIPSIVEVKGRYRSRAAIMREKLGMGAPVNDFLQSRFENGHAWEAKIKEHFSSHGQHFEPCVVEHPEYSRFFASLDGLSEDGIVLEVKTTSKKAIIDQIVNGDAPPLYNYQIQWQLFVTGLNEALLAVVHGDEIYTLPVHRDDLIIAECVEAVGKFLNELDTKKKEIAHEEHCESAS